MNTGEEIKRERVIAYIDGFNLYFGMKQSRRNDLLWLNVQELASSLLKPNQQLVGTKYFTSRVKNNPSKEKKQTTYLEALQTLNGLDIHYGHYQSQIEECRRCGHTYPYSQEKMTDVNIAVQMMCDAFSDKYDVALLITGDSDLVPPIKAVHTFFPKKRVIVGFPPNRTTISVQQAAKGSFVIGRKKLKDAQLPEQVIKANGIILQRPTQWA